MDSIGASNDKFSRDFGISYLSLLAKWDCKNEFQRVYAMMEPTIYSDIDSITDQELLQKLNSIVLYKKSIGMGMSK